MLSRLEYINRLWARANEVGCAPIAEVLTWVRSGVIQSSLRELENSYVQYLANICRDLYRNRQALHFWVKQFLQSEPTETTVIALSAIPLLILYGRLPTLCLLPLLVGDLKEGTIYLADTINTQENIIALLLPTLLAVYKKDTPVATYILLLETARNLPATFSKPPLTDSELQTAKTLLELLSRTFMNSEINYENFINWLTDLLHKHKKLAKQFTVSNGKTIRELSTQALYLGLYYEPFPRRIRLYLKRRDIERARNLLETILNIVSEVNPELAEKVRTLVSVT